MREYSNKKPEEMTMDELIEEFSYRMVEAKTTIRSQIDAAIEKGGVDNNPTLDEILKLDAEYEIRINALGLEMIMRDPNPIEGFSWPKCREGDEPDA